MLEKLPSDVVSALRVEFAKPCSLRDEPAVHGAFVQREQCGNLLLAGMTGQELSHQETKDVAPLGGKRLAAMIKASIGHFS